VAAPGVVREVAERVEAVRDGQGRFLTRTMSAGEVAIHDLGGVEAKAHREAKRHARRGRRAEHEGDGDDSFNDRHGPAARRCQWAPRGASLREEEGELDCGSRVGYWARRSAVVTTSALTRKNPSFHELKNKIKSTPGLCLPALIALGASAASQQPLETAQIRYSQSHADAAACHKHTAQHSQRSKSPSTRRKQWQP
jgi:hypothetical protein